MPTSGLGSCTQTVAAAVDFADDKITVKIRVFLVFQENGEARDGAIGCRFESCQA
jgi:hypothetical protein